MFLKIKSNINLKLLNKKFLINNLLEILILWIEIEIIYKENKHNSRKFKIIQIACKNQIYQLKSKSNLDNVKIIIKFKNLI